MKEVIEKWWFWLLAFLLSIVILESLVESKERSDAIRQGEIYEEMIEDYGVDPDVALKLVYPSNSSISDSNPGSNFYKGK